MTIPEAPVDPNPPFPDEADDSPHNPRKALIEWGIIIVVALVVAFIIKTFAIQAFYIPSESMDPALKVHDRVLVNKLSYRFGEIERGDIVVFERPPEEQGGDPAIKDLIKRVVGMPGDKVEGRDGHLWVNDQQLNEPYLADGVTTLDFPVQTVAADHYWVMGDNRPRSKDSRYFGAIHEDLIVGRAFIRVWPIPSVSLL